MTSELALLNVNKTEIYTFKGFVDSYLLEPHVAKDIEVDIVFQNDVFKEVRFDFGRKMYSRDDWNTLASITHKIEEVEWEIARRLERKGPQ